MDPKYFPNPEEQVKLSKLLCAILRHELNNKEVDFVDLLAHPSLHRTGWEPYQILYVLQESRRGNEKRFFVQDYGSKTLVSTTPITRSAPKKGLPHKRKILFCKFWFGFPINHAPFYQELEKVFPLKRQKKLHFSISWCRMNPDIFDEVVQTTTTQLISDLMKQSAAEVELQFSSFSLVGKEKNKICLHYKPVFRGTSLSAEDFYVKQHEAVLSLFRKIADDYAQKKGEKVVSEPSSPSRSLEFGRLEGSGEPIYELKVHHPFFHVTVGRGDQQKVDSLQAAFLSSSSASCSSYSPSTYDIPSSETSSSFHFTLPSSSAVSSGFPNLPIEWREVYINEGKISPVV
eukprot:TRINITY_DN520_c0_g1_i4.p1 TRINITY_DN520_c0_g1~~TRINITY_DN520_c0_g1_i4.p1  ORF type:complete len:398 (-),score=104.22 TRINITY_DN520_c0_g1_i4:1036-2070(-)